MKSLYEYSSVRAVILGMGMLGLSTTPSHARPAMGNITVQYHAHREEALPEYGTAFSMGGAASS